MEEQNPIDNDSFIGPPEVIEGSKVELVESGDIPGAAQPELSVTERSAAQLKPAEAAPDAAAVDAQLKSAALGKHHDIDIIRCLPAQFIAGFSKAQAINRPLYMFGQASAVFIVIALSALVWANRGFGLGVVFFVYLAPLLVVSLLLFLHKSMRKVKAYGWAEFIAGAMYPFSFLEEDLSKPLSVSLLGDVLQGRDKYSLAAMCYGEIIRNSHPLDILNERRSLEREFILSLAYAGNLKAALQYTEISLRRADYLRSVTATATTLSYSAYVYRNAAFVYELAGNEERASDFRMRCYELTKDLGETDESFLYGNLAMGEYYFQKGKFSEAITHLKVFVENVREAHQSLRDPALLARINFLLSVCHAQLGQLDEARQYHSLGLVVAARDCATYVHVGAVIAEVHILKASGREDEIDSVIDSCVSQLKLHKGSFLLQQLKNLHSNPSDFSFALQPDEFDEVHPEHDEEPMLRPPLWSERLLLNGIKNRALRFLLLALVVMIIYPHEAVFCVIAVGILALGFGWSHKKSLEIKRADAAIAHGKPEVVEIIFSGFKDILVMGENEKTRHTMTSGKGSLKFFELAGSKPFEAIAYRNSQGKICAFQVLGQYVSVSSK